MTVSALLQGPRKTTGTDLTTASATAVFTATSGAQETVTAVSICNTDDSNACTYTIEFNDGSTDFMVVNETNLAAKARAEHSFEMHFNGSGSLKVTAQNANDLHVLVSSISTFGANALR